MKPSVQKIPADALNIVRDKIIEPLRDAMILSSYKEGYRKPKSAGQKEYHFEIKGQLKHEMYLKVIYRERIKNIVGKDYRWKLTITPNKHYNPEAEAEKKVRCFTFVIAAKG